MLHVDFIMPLIFKKKTSKDSSFIEKLSFFTIVLPLMLILVFYCHTFIKNPNHLWHFFFFTSPKWDSNVGKNNKTFRISFAPKIIWDFTEGTWNHKDLFFHLIKREELEIIRFISYVTIYELPGKSQIETVAEPSLD